ncbi:MAG: hypothetical protein QOE47_1801, partial [Pyrinomonadaceae bacterium]|nr:hypothetical protein [Pyrinomonadaceae bacterium]
QLNARISYNDGETSIMAEQDERQGTTSGQTPDGADTSSDTGDIHRPRPPVERQTEEGTAGQGLGQITGATREDAEDKG